MRPAENGLMVGRQSSAVKGSSQSPHSSLAEGFARDLVKPSSVPHT